MRRLLLLLALIASLVVAACGDDDTEPTAARGDARELLQRAFNGSMPSGRLALEADVRIDGSDGEEEYGLDVSGPFVSRGGEQLPSLDLEVSVSGLGPPLSGGLIVTEDNAFVSFGGESYEVGEELFRRYNRDLREGADGRTTLEDFGVDAARWLRNPEIAGEEDVEGTSTTKISGEIDAARVLEDFAEIDREYGAVAGMEPLELDDAERERIAGAVEESRADVYVADDGTLRRLVLDLEFQVPEELREDAGLDGGSVTLDLAFSEVGEEQRITPPRDAKPLGDLLGRFGLGEGTLQ